MTIDDYNELLSGPKGDWFNGRWFYYETVANLVKDLDCESVIEIGPGGHTIVRNCDIMVIPEDDFWGRPQKHYHRMIKHNATEKPWPIADKQYDLLIALQVWEHLDSKQSRAFREVMRIAKSAILSFPYMWDCPQDNSNYPEHHMIDKELIGDWTLNIMPEKIIELPRTSNKVSRGPRLIYYWCFE